MGVGCLHAVSQQAFPRSRCVSSSDSKRVQSIIYRVQLGDAMVLQTD